MLPEKAERTMQPSKLDPSDHSLAIELFRNAFSDSEGPEEGEVIAKLVDELLGDTSVLGFIAGNQQVPKEKILACILFSPLCFDSPDAACLLSPVAVRTDHQQQGIGQELIRYGLEKLKQSGVNWVFTYGDPRYYSKTGFEPVSQEQALAPFKLTQPEGWLAQSLNGSTLRVPKGKARCVPAFNHPEYW